MQEALKAGKKVGFNGEKSKGKAKSRKKGGMFGESGIGHDRDTLIDIGCFEHKIRIARGYISVDNTYCIVIFS